MVDLFFSEFFFQFVILATKNISADVAEKFLLGSSNIFDELSLGGILHIFSFQTDVFNVSED